MHRYQGDVKEMRRCCGEQRVPRHTRPSPVDEHVRRGSRTGPSRLAGRGPQGEPFLAALAYVSLGDDAEGHARRYLTDYYRFLGDFAEQIAASALMSPEAVQDDVAAFEAAGCDELIPCNADVAQVGLISETVPR